jgi:hypothetical protein
MLSRFKFSVMVPSVSDWPFIGFADTFCNTPPMFKLIFNVSISPSYRNAHKYNAKNISIILYLKKSFMTIAMELWCIKTPKHWSG